MKNGSVEKEQDDLSVPHQQDEQLKEKPQENIDGLQDAAIEDPMKEIPIQAGESPLQQSKANEKNKKQEDILMRLSVGKSDEEKVGPQPNKRTSKMLSILNKGKKVPRKIKIIISLSAAVVAIFIILSVTVIHPSIQYKSAVEAMNSGDYDTAISIFEDLDGFKDSEKLIKSCKEGSQISSFIYRYNGYAQSTDGVIGKISATISNDPDENYIFEVEDGASIHVETDDYDVVGVMYQNRLVNAAENYTTLYEDVSAIIEGMDYSLSEGDRESILTFVKEYNLVGDSQDLVVNGVEYSFFLFFKDIVFMANRD